MERTCNPTYLKLANKSLGNSLRNNIAKYSLQPSINNEEITFHILFWNIENSRKINDMSSNDKSVLQANHILCLYETWQEKSHVISCLNRYSKVERLAQRDNKQGRAKGGLVIFFRNDIFNCTERWIEQENFIGVWLHVNGINILLLCVYIQPYASHDDVVIECFEWIANMKQKFPNDFIIVGGDFNANVGEENQIFHETAHSLGRLNAKRESEDKIIKYRGNMLLEYAEIEEMLIVNGRSISDMKGSFTLANARGSSVIDLVLISDKVVDKCSDFKILDMIHSSHFPCQLSFFLRCEEKQLQQKRKLIWKTDAVEDYCKEIKKELGVGKEISYTELLSTIETAASRTKMVIKPRNENQTNKWYDNECKEAKKLTLSRLKVMRNSNMKESRQEYISHRNRYRKIVREKKDAYIKTIRKQLGNSKNGKEFWSAVKYFRSLPRVANEITEEAWIDFYNNMMPRKSLSSTFFEGNDCELMDSNIEIHEVRKALAKIANKKAPGPDGVKNEFLKNLPEEGIEFVTKLFNEVFIPENIPNGWVESCTVMIYKKGSPLDCMNYRPIALLNSLLKLFTQVLETRLKKWAEENKVIPEAQGGFREGRSCDDQIFVLNSTIQLNLQKKRGKVFALFVDFERAFPSIPHEKLYEKLHRIGVSSKFIRILQNIYGQATTKIRTEHGETEAINITAGLLQGKF